MGNGITAETGLVFAMPLGEHRWQVINGTISIVEGLLHKVSMGALVVRSAGENVGLTLTCTLPAEIEMVGNKQMCVIREMRWENGQMASVRLRDPRAEIVMIDGKLLAQ